MQSRSGPSSRVSQQNKKMGETIEYYGDSKESSTITIVERQDPVEGDRCQDLDPETGQRCGEPAEDVWIVVAQGGRSRMATCGGHRSGQEASD